MSTETLYNLKTLPAEYKKKVQTVCFGHSCIEHSIDYYFCPFFDICPHGFTLSAVHQIYAEYNTNITEENAMSVFDG